MAAIKPAVSDNVVREVVRETLGPQGFNVFPLTGGNVAQAFSIDMDGARYVLRFNADTLDANFEKEAFIAATFESASIPIPEIVSHGRIGALRFCLSCWAEGTRLDLLAPTALLEVLPYVAETLIAIHASNVSQFDGSGVMDGVGRGFFPDWPSYLLSVGDEERVHGFFGKWHSLFDTTFLQRDTFDGVYRHLETMIPHLPAGRQLFHGNYGFGNVLVAEHGVVAVIDWIEAGYGDFVYDVAWLDYWDTELGFAQRLLPLYQARGYNVDRWNERVRCYQCRIALDSMRFYAKAGDERSYDFTTRRIVQLLA